MSFDHSTDKHLHYSTVKPGDKLVADGGFTCIAEGAHLIVDRGLNGELFVPCDEGEHYLDGQEDENGFLIGLDRVPV